MVKECMSVSYFLRELEKSNGKILCDLVSMARFANIYLSLLTAANSREHENIDLFFHTRRTIDHLQREAGRQAQLLEALKRELVHARDEEPLGFTPCVPFDYTKVETG